MTVIPPLDIHDEMDLEDFIAEAIDDSMDMDWSSRWGARAILRNLKEEGVWFKRLRKTTFRTQVFDQIAHAATALTVLFGADIWSGFNISYQTSVWIVLCLWAVREQAQHGWEVWESDGAMIDLLGWGTGALIFNSLAMYYQP